MGIKEYRKIFSLFLVIVMVFSFFGSAFAQQSNDIKGHWAEGELSIWLETGLLKGYPDGSIKPNNPITRAEFVTLINKAFVLTVEAGISFTDIAQTNWEYEQVAKAVEAGFIFGYEDGTFRSNNHVTRQEAAVMLARLLDIEGDEEAANTYADRHALAAWSKGAVGALSELGVMTGYKNGTYQPERKLTRAESVVILQRILDLLNEGTSTTIIDEPGEYGTAETQAVIEGDLIIFSPDVTLHNMIITGDLIIAEEVGEGDVFLKQVTVEGMTIIQGGGENSIHLEDSIFLTITVDKQNGSVRIVAVGSTSVQEVFLLSGAILEERNGTASGFSHVYLADTLPQGSEVRLLGSFDSVEVFSQSVLIGVPRGLIGEFFISEGSQTSLELGKEAQIISLVLDAVVKVIGQGKISKATLNEGALGSAFANAPESMTGPGAPRPSSGGGGTGGGGGPTDIPVSNILLSPKNLVLSVGGTGKLATTIQPSNASNQEVTWISNDEEVVTVDKNGLVTATGKGTTTITATSASDSSKTANIEVKVVDIIEASFEPTGEVAIYNEPIGQNEDGEFIFIKEIGKEFRLVAGENVINFKEIKSYYDEENDTKIEISYPYENLWVPLDYLAGIIELKFITKDGNFYTARVEWQEIYNANLKFNGPLSATEVFTEAEEFSSPSVDFSQVTTKDLINISTQKEPNHYAIEVELEGVDISARNIKKMFRSYGNGFDDEIEYIEEEITDGFNPQFITTKWAEGKNTVVYLLQDDSIYIAEVYIDSLTPKDLTPVAGATISLEFLGHSAFILETEQQKILMDPFMPDSFLGFPETYTIPDAASIDLITVSHQHADHNYVEVAPEVDKKVYGVIINEQIGPTFVKVSDEEHGDVKLSTILLPHFEENFWVNEPNAGFIFDTAGMRIVHPGDSFRAIIDGLTTGEITDLKGNNGIDILMLPIGNAFEDAHEHDRLIKFVEDLQPKVVIPIHQWDTKWKFLDAVKTHGWQIVNKEANIQFSKNDLPSNGLEIWDMQQSIEFRPMFKEAVVVGDRLVITFNKTLNGNSIPATEDFWVVANDETVGVSKVEIEGDNVVLTLVREVKKLETIEVSYFSSPPSAIQDLAGNVSNSFFIKPVTNVTPAKDLEAPKKFILTSTAFNHEEEIPTVHSAVYAYGGLNISIPLSWDEAPDGTEFFAVIM